MRWQMTLAALTVIAAAFEPSCASAQTPPEPTVAIRVKSVDGLLRDAKYLAGLVGQADKAQEIEGVINALAGAKGIAGTGLDTSRPIAVYGIVGPSGIDSRAVLMVPVTDETALVELLTQLGRQAGVSLNKGPDGVYSVTIPKVPVGLFLRFANRYAYLGGPDRSVIESPLSPDSKALKASESDLFSVTLNVDRIPDSLKQIALQQFQVQIANEKDRKGPKESSAQTDLKRKALDLIFERVRAFLTDATAIDARISIDRDKGDLAAGLSVSAKAGSALAASFASEGTRTSTFANVSGDAALARLTLAVPAEIRDSLVAVIDEAVAQELDREADAAKKAVARRLYSAVTPTLKAGVLDVVAGLLGPNSSGHYSMFAGIQVQEGKGIETVIKEIAAQIPAREREALRLDAERIQGIAVHHVDASKGMDAEGRRIFGEKAQGLLAFRPDAVILTFGADSAASSMKSLLGSTSGPAPAIIDASGSLARLVGLDRERGSLARKAADEVFGSDPRGRDAIRFRLAGGPSLQASVIIKAEILKLAARLH